MSDMEAARAKLSSFTEQTLEQSLQRAAHTIPLPMRMLAHTSSRCAVCFRVAEGAGRQRSFVIHHEGDGWNCCGAAPCRQLMRRWSQHLHETTLTRFWHRVLMCCEICCAVCSKINLRGILAEIPIRFIRPKLGLIQEAFITKPQITFDHSMQRMMLNVDWTDEDGCDVSKWVPLVNIMQHTEHEQLTGLEQNYSDMLLFPLEWCGLSRSMFIRRLHLEFSLVHEMEMVIQAQQNEENQMHPP